MESGLSERLAEQHVIAVLPRGFIACGLIERAGLVASMNAELHNTGSGWADTLFERFQKDPPKSPAPVTVEDMDRGQGCAVTVHGPHGIPQRVPVVVDAKQRAGEAIDPIREVPADPAREIPIDG